MILPAFELNLALHFKVFLLIVIGLYAVFVFIVFANVRSLTKLVLIKSASGSKLVTSLTFLYLLVTIFLFILALVIL